MFPSILHRKMQNILIIKTHVTSVHNIITNIAQRTQGLI